MTVKAHVMLGQGQCRVNADARTPPTRPRSTAMTPTLFAACLLAISQPGERPAEPSRYLVATDGNGAWSGRLPAKADRSDGPFATPSRARGASRALKRDAGGSLPGSVAVAIHGGRYSLSEPPVLRPGDSGTERSRITH